MSSLFGFTTSQTKKARLCRIELSNMRSEFAVYVNGYSGGKEITVCRTANALRIVPPTEPEATIVDEMPYYDALACLSFKELSKAQKDYLTSTYKLLFQNANAGMRVI